MISISVPDITQQEADLLSKGLALPDVRAFVTIVGVLAALPSDQARGRVLRYCADLVDDDEIAEGES